jgi:hypothetical protein
VRKKLRIHSGRGNYDTRYSAEGINGSMIIFFSLNIEEMAIMLLTCRQLFFGDESPAARLLRAFRVRQGIVSNAARNMSFTSPEGASYQQSCSKCLTTKFQATRATHHARLLVTRNAGFARGWNAAKAKSVASRNHHSNFLSRGREPGEQMKLHAWE